MRVRLLQAMDGLSANLRSALAQSPASPATAAARVPFSWLLLFGQAKRSDWPPWMADEPHTDVGRFARQRQKKSGGLKPTLSTPRNREMHIPQPRKQTLVDRHRTTPTARPATGQPPPPYIAPSRTSDI